MESSVVLKSLTFDWHSKNSLCSHRSEMSCQCLIAHAFRQRAQPHPSRIGSLFLSQNTLFFTVPPPAVGHFMADNSQIQVFDPTALARSAGRILGGCCRCHNTRPQHEQTFNDFQELSRLCVRGGKHSAMCLLRSALAAGEARGGAQRSPLRAALAQQAPTGGRVLGAPSRRTARSSSCSPTAGPARSTPTRRTGSSPTFPSSWPTWTYRGTLQEVREAWP